MNKIILYNKYRPSNFDEIYGQSAITQVLRNQIISNRINHTYLFHGLRGSGKTSIARIFAKAVNCSNTVNGNPCNQCESCKLIDSKNIDIIEIDAASNNSVDNIRKLIDEVKYKPINLRYKVYIIDEIHMLSTGAFNSLLKTIEEPPEHAIFILATTEFNKIPDTIKSRCQIYTFKQLSINEIKSNLKYILEQENINRINDNCLEFIAKKADGSMRDAISILDQCLFINDNNEISVDDLYKLFGDITDNIVSKIADCIENHNITKGLDILHEQYINGVDLYSLLNSLYRYYFNKFISGSNESVIFERYINILAETMQSLLYSKNKMVIVEITFIKMCKPEMETDYNSVVQRINDLEKELLSLKNCSNKANEQEKFDENVILYYNNFYNHQTFILQEDIK